MICSLHESDTRRSCRYISQVYDLRCTHVDPHEVRVCASTDALGGFLFPILERLGLPGREGFYRARHRVVGPPTSGDARSGAAFAYDLNSWEQIETSWITAADVSAARVRRFLRRIKRVADVHRTE